MASKRNSNTNPQAITKNLSQATLSGLFDEDKFEEALIKSKIRQRRAQMLVHSAIYYDLNDNVVSDDQWQKWAEELAKLQNDNPQCCKIGYFDQDFADWDGTTGAMLQYRHPLVYPKAVWLLNYHKNIV